LFLLSGNPATSQVGDGQRARFAKSGCCPPFSPFRERLNRSNALTARFSKSAYTVYILHPFFVVTATGLLKDVPLPPLPLAVLACSVVLIVAFTCANLIRQAPLLNKVL